MKNTFHLNVTGLLNEGEQYTLQPLIDFGAESLAGHSGDLGLNKASLIEVQINLRDKHNSREILQGSNVFETLRERNRLMAFQKGVSLRLATIKVAMADGREHTLTIVPPDDIIYDGDRDLIHLWLRKRGFVIHKSLRVKKIRQAHSPISGIFLTCDRTVPL